jgi:hypothetical protein
MSSLILHQEALHGSEVREVSPRSAECEALCLALARELVGRVSLKQATRILRSAMGSEALTRTRGSRRAAAFLLGVDRRYVQRIARDAQPSRSEPEVLADSQR